MTRKPNSRALFDWKALALLALLVLAAGYSWYSTRPVLVPVLPELRPFAEKYGPSRNSQFGEEWLIRDFFQDKRGGIFVDVGANHHQLLSTTYYLENALAWSGIAVEPLAQFAEGYAVHRPRTKFRPFFVSDASDQEATLYVLKHKTLVSSADKSFTERWGSNAEAVTTPTITLNDLLTAEKIDRFDFLSMDIETWEPKALAGFDIQRFRPALVCIEAHEEVLQQILDYFTHNQYVLVGKYLKADENNLYFSPLQ